VHTDVADFSGFSFSEPLDLGYLSAYARAEGFDADAIDMLVDKKARDVKKLLAAKKYDLVAFTGHVTAHRAINELAAQVKEFDKNIITTVCGIMAAVNPHVYDNTVLDAIINLDPFETFVSILKKLAVGKRDFLSIAGVYHKDKPKGEVVRYVPKHFPLREKLATYAHNYRHSYKGPFVSIKTSYGCPNGCNFCLYAKGGYDKYWERDLDNVLDEIEDIAEPNIFILDDNFTANIKRIAAFCDGLEARKINKTFFMLATAKAIAKNPELIERFVSNGLKYVFLGVESFSTDNLEHLNKRGTPEENHEALMLLKKLDVEVNAGIICLPHFKKEDFDSLIENLEKYNPIFPMVNVLAPMPGTPMHDVHAKEALVKSQKYEAFNMMELIIEPTNMTAKEFYTNLLRVYRATMGSPITLKYIKERYGAKELLRHKKISGKVNKKFKMLMKQNKGK